MLFRSIETFLQQRGFIEPTLLYFQDSAEELASIRIDWDRLLLLVHLLKPFYQVISRFANENSAPISLVFGMMPHLIDHLSNSAWSYDDLSVAAHNFKLNLVCYRDAIQSDVTNLATVLDPRIKLTFVAQESRQNMIDCLRKRLSHIKLKTQAEADLPEQMQSAFPEMSGDEIDDYLAAPRSTSTRVSTPTGSAIRRHIPACTDFLAHLLVSRQPVFQPSECLMLLT